jgi:hypothetical protein
MSHIFSILHDVERKRRAAPPYPHEAKAIAGPSRACGLRASGTPNDESQATLQKHRPTLKLTKVSAETNSTKRKAPNTKAPLHQRPKIRGIDYGSAGP